ncbi:hypothetical protein PsorP6_009310 [Peronosclerospora sorghi]|uniref:Uncharacterized protein n=1 Tax=Peronosclerospora sorghi TaxID=230839 RepID=A0ACC0VYX1_9STRA|nr:hypothetical protein PsorP6_009310 [Peronosclerospora sorghi]
MEEWSDSDRYCMQRLVASLCELETPEVLTRAIEKESLFQREVEEEKSSRTGETQSDTVASQLLRSIDVRSCNSKGLTKTLHSIGLVEKSETEIAQVGLSRPTDDEVSQEIRLLQRQLDSCVRETNETKRKLRKRMNETNPWLRREREEEETIIKTYFTMWQTKKELARKRKLREKKRQRRRGYGGGTSGNPPLDNWPSGGKSSSTKPLGRVLACGGMNVPCDADDGRPWGEGYPYPLRPRTMDGGAFNCCCCCRG